MSQTLPAGAGPNTCRFCLKEAQDAMESGLPSLEAIALEFGPSPQSSNMRGCIQELMSMAKLPEPLLAVLECVCILLGIKPTNFRQLFVRTREAMDSIYRFDKDSVPLHVLQSLEKRIDCLGTPAQLSRLSLAGEHLVRWCTSVYRHAKLAHRITYLLSLSSVCEHLPFGSFAVACRVAASPSCIHRMFAPQSQQQPASSLARAISCASNYSTNNLQRVRLLTCSGTLRKLVLDLCHPSSSDLRVAFTPAAVVLHRCCNQRFAAILRGASRQESNKESVVAPAAASQQQLTAEPQLSPTHCHASTPLSKLTAGGGGSVSAANVLPLVSPPSPATLPVAAPLPPPTAATAAASAAKPSPSATRPNSVMHALEKITISMSGIMMADLIELSRMPQCPPSLAAVCGCVCLFFREQPTFHNFKRRIKSPERFLQQLLHYDKDSVDPNVLRSVTEYLECHPELSAQQLMAVSKAGVGLWNWCTGLHQHASARFALAVQRAPAAVRSAVAVSAPSVKSTSKNSSHQTPKPSSAACVASAKSRPATAPLAKRAPLLQRPATVHPSNSTDGLSASSAVSSAPCLPAAAEPFSKACVAPTPGGGFVQSSNDCTPAAASCPPDISSELAAVQASQRLHFAQLRAINALCSNAIAVSPRAKDAPQLQLARAVLAVLQQQ